MFQILLLWLNSYHQFFLLLIIGFSYFNFYNTKIRNNFVGSIFCIHGSSSKPKDNLRVKLNVKSDICLLSSG